MRNGGAAPHVDDHARALLVKNRNTFASRYPGAVARVAGEYSGNLDNAGERVTLQSALREPILDFTYSPGWQPITDGAGFSLEPVLKFGGVLFSQKRLSGEARRASIPAWGL